VLFLGGLRAGAAVAPLPTRRHAGAAGRHGARQRRPLFFADASVPAVRHQVPRIRMDDRALRCLAGARGPPPKPVDIQPDWPFNIIYSSGTTGTPKGIVQPHGDALGARGARRELRLRPDAVALVATSLCSNTTLVGVPCLAKGGCGGADRRAASIRRLPGLAEARAPRTRCWCRCSTSA
jgi:long-chain acyl-CoA synthetase